ncbi:dihydrofolate reductase family protein [Arthrobacter sp. ISL-28]|nr:dihydrofolate reductase family protein [Arthrobacter sp. ISL-28]
MCQKRGFPRGLAPCGTHLPIRGELDCPSDQILGGCLLVSMGEGVPHHCRVIWKACEARIHVRVGGGIGTARDFLRAGLVDRLHLMVAPILLGRGNRLWDDLPGLDLTHKVTTEVAESGTTHITFTR